jgi:hypothetical protein
MLHHIETVLGSIAMTAENFASRMSSKLKNNCHRCCYGAVMVILDKVPMVVDGLGIKKSSTLASTAPRIVMSRANGDARLSSHTPPSHRFRVLHSRPAFPRLAAIRRKDGNTAVRLP